MLQTILAIAKKEFLQLSRNHFMLRMIATFQVVQLLMLGFIDTTARNLPLAIVDQDQSTYSRELLEKVRATNTFEVRFITTSIAQAREHVRSGRAKAALVIPPDFHGERAKRGSARVLAMVDGSDSVASAQALAAIEGMTSELEIEVEPETSAEKVTLHTMLLFNPQGKTSNFTLPALLAMIMANAYMTLAAMSLVRERGMGTLERLLMTPLSYPGFMIGKTLPYLVVGLVNATVLLLAMRWGFRVPIHGSMLLLAVSLVVYLATSLGFGVSMAAAARGPSEVHGQLMRLQIPMFFLSGYLFPLSSLPAWLLPIAYLLPATHMIEIMRGVTLRGAGLADLWVHLLYLCVAAPALVLLAVRRFKKTTEG